MSGEVNVQLGRVELPRNHSNGSHHITPQKYGANFIDDSLVDVEKPCSVRYSEKDEPRQDEAEIKGIVGKVEKSRFRTFLLHTAFTARITVKFFGVGLMLAFLIIAIFRWPRQITEDHSKRDQVMSFLFIVGLSLVALEEAVGINKSAIMLLLAATMWTLLAVGFHPNISASGARTLHHELDRALRDVGSVILFLLPAMGVVETIDHFEGFTIITKIIRQGMNGQKTRLMPIICVLTFFLSSVIDNLTSTIVALKILRHVVVDDEDYRQLCGGLVVIASNAGGAFSPIGDVTTTMLWIQAKISPAPTILWLLLPSFVAGTLPLAGVYCQVRGNPSPKQKRRNSYNHEHEPLKLVGSDELLNEEVTVERVLVLVVGIGSILMVPVLKMTCGVPPYLGMLLALGVMWLFTDAMVVKNLTTDAENQDDNALVEETSTHFQGIVAALHKVDLTGLFFFTGVLLAVGALDSAGVLRRYGAYLVRVVGNNDVALCVLLGISSAFVDNVPLVEGAIDMFEDVEIDAPLWQLIALAAGTGGSILSVGSIAGVTFMSLEGVSFIWYCKRISLWALVGFFMGIATYKIQRMVFG